MEAAAVVEDTPLGVAVDTVVDVEVEVGAVLIWWSCHQESGLGPVGPHPRDGECSS